MAKLTDGILRRQAKEVRLFRMLTKIIGCSILALSSVLMITYAASALYVRTGSYTVSVAKRDKLNYSICLSETPDFTDELSRLTCGATEEITNIKGEEIPADVDSINGQHSGENYLAYTYYLKNNGLMTVDYLWTLSISSNVNDLASAVRVRLYVDGVPTTYARVNKVTGQPEPITYGDESGNAELTVPFLTDNTIAKSEVVGFAPKDIHKFTVVIWIEGDDPDTVNERLGGEFKVNMTMEVLRTDEES